MRHALLSLGIALAVGGCSLGDCSFETSEAETRGGLLLTDGSAVGDTLTVAFVDSGDPTVVLTTAPGVGDAPRIAPDAIVQVLYDAAAQSFSGDVPPRASLAVPLGGTGFVYVDGTLDPTVLRQVCSPRPTTCEVEARDVLVPVGTVAVRVALVPLPDLSGAPAEALRQSDEARRPARPIHI